MHHNVKYVNHFIKKNPTRCNNVSNFIIPYLCEAQHVSGDTPPIIRSLKLHCQPLVFHTWKVVCTCSWWKLSGTILCLTTSTNYTYKQSSTYEKPEAASSWWKLSGTILCLTTSTNYAYKQPSMYETPEAPDDWRRVARNMLSFT